MTEYCFKSESQRGLKKQKRTWCWGWIENGRQRFPNLSWQWIFYSSTAWTLVSHNLSEVTPPTMHSWTSPDCKLERIEVRRGNRRRWREIHWEEKSEKGGVQSVTLLSHFLCTLLLLLFSHVSQLLTRKRGEKSKWSGQVSRCALW